MIKKIYNCEFSLFGFQLSGKRVVMHPFFAGSAVMIIGSNSANFFAYIYHLIVGRMLGPASYGDLAAILSLVAIIATSFTYFGTVIVKFVSSSGTEVHLSLYHWFEKKAIYVGLAISFLVFVFSGMIGSFMQLEKTIILLIAPIFFSLVLGTVYRSFLQGLLKFKELVISNNFEMITIVLLTTLVVYWGYDVLGSAAILVIGSFLTLLLMKLFLQSYKKGKVKEKFGGGREILLYTIPIFVVSISSMSLISTDLLLVKHFFSAHDAGIYASLATLGKIIFYGTAPVGTVMFPLVAKRHSKGEKYKNILFLSFLATLAIASLITLIYFLFPKVMINILYGSAYLEGAPYLVWYGVFVLIFSLMLLVANYFLSIGKTKVTYSVALAAVFQAVAIWFNHGNILQVITMSIIATTLLLVFLLIYFAYAEVRTAKVKG